MNYKEIYDNLIFKAKEENRIKYKGIYYENHHIIPKCLGGGEIKENMVLLTAKEHYICHELLVCIYPHNKKLLYALWRLINPRGKQGYKVSAKSYEKLKKEIAETPISEQARQKMRDNRPDLSGKNNPMFGKNHSIESLQKMAIKATNRKFSLQTRQKMKENHKGMEGRNHNINTIQIMRDIKIGENNPMFGRKHSEESKNQMKKKVLINE